MHDLSISLLPFFRSRHWQRPVRHSALAEAAHALHALLLERLIADREHLVNDQPDPDAYNAVSTARARAVFRLSTSHGLRECANCVAQAVMQRGPWRPAQCRAQQRNIGPALAHV